MVGEKAPGEWPEHAGDPEGGADESLVLPSLRGREQIGDDDEGHGE